MIDATSARVQVLGCFEVVVGGEPVAVPLTAQRVLGFLAVVEQPQRREVLAGRLWGELPHDRAQASLRNALWLIRRASIQLVQATRDLVGLGRDVEVDLTASRHLAHRVIDGEPVDDRSLDAPIRLLERELLPAWDDDWLRLERERTRQLHIHALEALSRALTLQGRYAQAIEAAYAAVTAEPLRESARVVLIEAYLAEGNRCQAVREVGDYRRLLHDELGVSPSPRLEAALAPLCIARHTP